VAQAVTHDPDASADSARHLRDIERAELAAADDGWTPPLGYAGPAWEAPTQAEAALDAAW
jgi:hypothetical protein